MRFRFKERVEAEPDALMAAFASAELYESMDLPDVGAPEVLEITAAAAGTRTRIRYRYSGDLPPAASTFVRADRLTWVEDAVHAADEHIIRFTLQPDHYSDRLRSRGAHRFEPGPEPGTSWWSVEGELSIRLPFMAGQVERAIIGGLGRNLAAQVPVFEAYCARR